MDRAVNDHPNQPGASPLPPDRGGVLTEQRNPRTADLHALGVEAIVERMQTEDRAVLGALETARPALVALLEDAEPRFLRGGRLVYLGAGTSGRLGVLDASEAPPTFHVEPGRVVGLIAGGDAALRRSSEHREDEPDGAREQLEALGLTDDDTVIGIAAGGTTPYPRGALTIAKSIAPGCLTALLSCAPVEPPPNTDHTVVIPTGPEVITGSTRMKAGTATKLALNTISTTLMIREGRVFENLMVDLRATNDKLRDRAARIITTLTGLERDAAMALLERAGGEVKTSIVMHRIGVDTDEARRVLQEAKGRLADALADPSNSNTREQR